MTPARAQTASSGDMSRETPGDNNEDGLTRLILTPLTQVLAFSFVESAVQWRLIFMTFTDMALLHLLKQAYCMSNRSSSFLLSANDGEVLANQGPCSPAGYVRNISEAPCLYTAM